jgi:hypothetical protein
MTARGWLVPRTSVSKTCILCLSSVDLGVAALDAPRRDNHPQITHIPRVYCRVWGERSPTGNWLGLLVHTPGSQNALQTSRMGWELASVCLCNTTDALIILILSFVSWEVVEGPWRDGAVQRVAAF